MSSTSNWLIIGAVALLLVIGAWFVASGGSGGGNVAPALPDAGATAPAADAPATADPNAAGGTAPAADPNAAGGTAPAAGN